MQKKLSKMLFVISSFCLLSCTSVPNFRGCLEREMTKGYCCSAVSGRCQDVDDTHPLLGEDGKPIINKETGKPWTWWELRPFLVSIPFFDYAELKKYLIVNCKNNRQCDDRIASWDRTIQNMDEAIKER